MATQEAHTLRVVFFPFMAPGHMLPMLDMAKLFSARGVNCTVLTTPANAASVRSSLSRDSVEVLLVPFPFAAAGLPDGCENLYSVPSPELEPNFFRATGMLREPFSQLLSELLPDCVVTDMFLPWAYHVSAELDIPVLLFYGLGFFSLCLYDSIARHDPLKSLPEEAESFVVPGLPHKIEMFKSQIENLAEVRPDLLDIIIQAKEVEARCYGLVMNTFYQLEPEYVKHYTEVVGRRAWHLGPVSLCNSDMGEKAARGNGVSNEHQNVLNWLESKSPGSVVYVCFGSGCHFSTAQLYEIALGLEAAECPFVWVVRQDEEGWMPEGYDERIQGKGGLIVRGWAPQILILNHEAVGGFVTHCGWNSTLEGVSAGLPFVTWPQFADQFFNERLIVDVLKIGVEIGVKSLVAKHKEKELVKAAKIEAAIRKLIGGGGEDGEARKRRAEELGTMARKAVEDGGSSCVDMDNLIHDLEDRRTTKL
ncbi:scopoletin glucosyltransferase-like [Iris pallida]|uniref:Scopoletin glucosyltransferase-like n=1 Tax=Iris pallida TaxID=29817 RepID=A0AAX6FK44_IRIPA|nr:scopoletin glucosyltransferase-like [Iris pallida]KAJ6824947.1 scopoletin glucosyltransferase-like [Iris pallida]